jgi:FKBP-type peptidyl-prolyl cis-trans isomerase FkpA/FKBP-type peptidyl-prolyl cis-trans isomerase FklB
MSEDDKTLYALGILISQNLKGFQLTSTELDTVKQGLTDGVMNQPLKVEADKYRPQVEQLHQTRMAAAGKLEAEAGSAYLEKAAVEKGAVKTASGLVITELKPGTGASPKPTDQVKVHYQGTLINGKVFDSSLQRGEPATFPLNGVIPCWTEALQLMKVGGKSRLVCPAAIAYGERGAPPDIKPGATLVFEVELLEIMK